MADIVGVKEVKLCSGFAGRYSAIGVYCAPFGYKERYAIIKSSLCFITLGLRQYKDASAR